MERDEGVGGPMPALDIHISERQMECNRPNNDELHKGRILADAGGEEAILKI